MGQGLSEKHEIGEDFLNNQKEFYTQLQKRHVTLWVLTAEGTETGFKPCSPYAVHCQDLSSCVRMGGEGGQHVFPSREEGRAVANTAERGREDAKP